MALNIQQNKKDYLLEYANKYSILYVEDSKTARKSMRDVLSIFFKDIKIAQDGLHGLKSFQKFSPNIIITDINMPNMNGLELIEEVQKIDSEVSFIILTGFTENKHLLKALELGINKYLIKPINENKLIDVLYQSVYDLEFKYQFERMKEERELLNLTMDLSPVLTVLEKSGDVKYMNNSFLDFLGYENHEEFTSSHRYLYEILDDLDSNIIFKNYDEYLANILNYEKNENKVSIKKKDKTYHIFKVIYKFYPHTDTLVSFFTDIDNIEEKTKELIKLSEVDTLTNIYNKYAFDKYFEIIYSKFRAKKIDDVSIVLINIDNLDTVNESYGRNTTDKIIHSVASFIKQNLYNGEFLARFNSDEFICILNNKDLKAAHKDAETLRLAFMEQFDSKLTCSFGATQFKISDEKKDILYRLNDAMLKAKKGGKNMVTIAI